MISIGTKAPDFTLSTATADGPKQLSLSSEIGKKNILLLFVPMAFTGVCTTELCEISKGIGAYESLDCTVLAISGDNPFAQQAWAAKEGITIPVLSDYEHSVAKAYGIAYDSFLPQIGLGMGGVAKRSAFLIDRAGVIQYAESHEDPKQLPDFAAIQKKLAELK
jgi:peroxiredoxin